MKCKKLISGIVAIMLVAVLAFGSTAAAVGAQADNDADLALASQNVSELTATTDSSASTKLSALSKLSSARSHLRISSPGTASRQASADFSICPLTNLSTVLWSV